MYLCGQSKVLTRESNTNAIIHQFVKIPLGINREYFFRTKFLLGTRCPLITRKSRRELNVYDNLIVDICFTKEGVFGTLTYTYTRKIRSQIFVW